MGKIFFIKLIKNSSVLYQYGFIITCFKFRVFGTPFKFLSFCYQNENPVILFNNENCLYKLDFMPYNFSLYLYRIMDNKIISNFIYIFFVIFILYQKLNILDDKNETLAENFKDKRREVEYCLGYVHSGMYCK